MSLDETVAGLMNSMSVDDDTVEHGPATLLATVVSDIKALYPPGVLHTAVQESGAEIGKDAHMDGLLITNKNEGLAILMHRGQMEPWLNSWIRPGSLALTTSGRIIHPVQTMGPLVVLFIDGTFYVRNRGWLMNICRLVLDLRQVEREDLEPVRFTSMLNRGEP